MSKDADLLIENATPMVSVIIGTYQHAGYISECIDSVLRQKTNFSFEIILGEDESNDGTREICREYQKKYPDKIHLFLRSRKDVIYVDGNPTGRFNFLENLKAAKGKYIALLDGDDYWTDDFKLQKQFDVLESHPEISVCHHWQKMAVQNANWQFEEKEALKEGQGYFPQTVATVADIFSLRLRPKIRTVLFRNVFKEHPFPKWFYEVKFGDEPINFFLGQFGKFYFIDEEMAVYRIINKGASSVFKNTKGSIIGNKAWLKIWALALKQHNFKFVPEALVGMKIFVGRIKSATSNSFSEKVKLLWFIFTKLETKRSIKKELKKSLFE